MHRRTVLSLLGASLCTPALARAAPVTLGLMTGELGGTFVRIGFDLAMAFDSETLRIDPHISMGSVQNISDLIRLPGVDLALAASDALTYVRSQGTFPREIDRIQYICKLYDEDLHVCAGPDIKTVYDLNGKPVNVDVHGSGTDLTAHAIFTALGVKPIYQNQPPPAGQAALEAGRIAANVYCIGAPGDLFRRVPASANLHLVPVPSNATIEQTYIPGGRFTNADYPTLVQPGHEVETVGVGVALANYGWAPNTQRYRNLALFVREFFGNFAKLLQPPHHPLWHEVDLMARIPGWTRFQPAVDWLDAAQKQMQAADTTATFESKFDAWLRQNGGANLTPDQRKQMMQAFERIMSSR